MLAACLRRRPGGSLGYVPLARIATTTDERMSYLADAARSYGRRHALLR